MSQDSTVDSHEQQDLTLEGSLEDGAISPSLLDVPADMLCILRYEQRINPLSHVREAPFHAITAQNQLESPLLRCPAEIRNMINNKLAGGPRILHRIVKTRPQHPSVWKNELNSSICQIPQGFLTSILMFWGDELERDGGLPRLPTT
jgi:hypothetical protein